MTDARARPPGVTDKLVEAVGKATEAFEYVIRHAATCTRCTS